MSEAVWRGPATWFTPLLPGTAHALTTVAVGSPFDIAKTRLQVGMFTSPWECMRSTVLQEGPLALYRGAWMPLASLTFKRPFEFAAFEWCNARLGKRDGGPFVGGFVAGIIAACLGCPFSVMKVQMQANRKDVYRHQLQVFQAIWRSSGPLGFYRGFRASLIMSVPSTTFYLGVYGILREALPSSKGNTAIAGMAASLAMWTIMLPLDNVRTVIQAKSFCRDEVVAGWLAHFREVVHGPRGLQGLWVGWTAVAMQRPIVSACSMLAYEQARSLADSWHK